MTETRSTTASDPLRQSLPWLFGLGLLLFTIGLFIAPERIWSAWLVSISMFTGLALFGPVFVAIVRLCSGRWAQSILPLAQDGRRALPWAAAFSVLVLFGASTLFEWAHVKPEEASHLLAGKLGWLNLFGFFSRTVLCFLIWFFGGNWMLKKPGRGRAGVYLVLFALSFAVYAFDWLMSLEPEWFSTIFALYAFSGLFLAGLAALTLWVLRADHRGTIKPIKTNQLHDLGKLMFAFSFFWGYIWYCQFMLIWYTNIPEETTWYATRMAGSWATLSYLSLAMNFVIPFLVLLPAPAKKNKTVLMRVAWLLIFGRWLDLYIIVTPTAFPDVPPMSLWEITLPVAAVAGFYWVIDHKKSRILSS